MWISARTATTLAAAALLLVLTAIAAPFLPKPHLPNLPEERAAKRETKFGAADSILQAPDRVRAQRMTAGAATLAGAACLGGRVGSGPAAQPSAEIVGRLVALLRDSRTVADPRAASAEPDWVVRLVKGERKLDVMADTGSDRIVVALDGATVGSYSTPALHREFAGLSSALFPSHP